MKRIFCSLAAAAVFLMCAVFSGCEEKGSESSLSYQPKNSGRASKIVIWTNCTEFTQYAEIYNKDHSPDSVVIVYKENPALSLPPAQDELAPDIIIGPWLRSDHPEENFKPLDFLFDYKRLTSQIFYPQLLEPGNYYNSQFLLPVSFNLPAIIFSSENSNLVTEDFTLTLNQIREIGSAYNEKNKKKAYTKIGFTPLGNEDFLYLSAKLMGADFYQDKGQISWNNDNFEKAKLYLRDWVQAENESPKTEEDFTFKYLFMPDYRQVTSGRTLFAYTTSDRLFKLMNDLNLNIDYRWINDYMPEPEEKVEIEEDSETPAEEPVLQVEEVSESIPVSKLASIPMEDSVVMLGIYRYAENVAGATDFITWFFQSDSQRKILERKTSLHLETEQFGIAGGFSAVRDVTEHILPLFYTPLLSNLPPAQMISAPNTLPPRWNSYLDLVVIPYLREGIKSKEVEDDTGEKYIAQTPIADLEREWRKKTFD